MFGYILPDKPNLYMKDYALYRAFYCGLCHQIGRCQGQCMRLGVNYDVTFLCILMHGLVREELPMQRKACVLNPFRRRPVVAETPMLRTMAYLNALLLDFKCRDDVQDGSHGKRSLRRLISRSVRRARRQLPEVAAVLDRAFEEQCRVEAARPASWHAAAEPFADAVQSIIRILAADRYLPELGMIGYLLGQYVYLLDAVDDYDSDIRRHQYNPLVLQYGSPTKAALIADVKPRLDAAVDQLVAVVRENYQHIPMFATEGIVTNTLWMGLKARADQVIKENVKCQKLHTKF